MSITKSEVGDLKGIATFFGFTHGRVSWTVKAPLGLDYYGLILAKKLVECKIAHREYVVDPWLVRNFETLQDHMGIRIEGLAKSVTLDDFAGNLLKIYQ